MNCEHEQVELFARAMERELRANEAKGGWHDVDPRVLISDTGYHLLKLIRAVRRGSPTRILEHAADVANCAMFVADVAGCLTAETVAARDTEPDYMEGSGGDGDGLLEAALLTDVRRERLDADRDDIPF